MIAADSKIPSSPSGDSMTFPFHPSDEDPSLGAPGSAPDVRDSKSQLRKSMGFWDVLLFNIAAVLGPRWIAAAGHNGTSSISLWVIAALFFFVPGAFIVVELSTRFP